MWSLVLYEGSRSIEKAEAAGLPVKSVADASKAADFIMILLPDEVQRSVYKESIEPGLEAGNVLAFAPWLSTLTLVKSFRPRMSMS